MGFKKDETARIIYLLVLVTAFFVISEATAQENSISLELNATGKYSDNIEYDRNNPKEDYYALISPSITFNRSSEVSDFSVKALVDIIRYQEMSEQNSENQEYSMAGSYSPSERISLFGNLLFKDDIALQGELADTGEVGTWQHRRQYIGQGGGSWRFSERTSVSSTYQYLKKEFENNSGVDYDQHSINLNLNRYMNNGIDAIRIVPAYNYTETDYSKVDNYNLSLGWQHTFSETFRMYLSMGGRYTEEKYDNGPQYDSSGWIASVDVTRSSEKGAFTLGYSRNLWINIEGGQTEIDQIRLSLNRWIFRRLSLGFNGAFYLRNQPDDLSQQKQTVFRVSPNLEFRLTERHILAVGYQYDHIRAEEGADNGTTEANMVWVTLRLNFDKIY